MIPEIESLIQRHLDGNLTPEESERLRGLLRKSKEIREIFCAQTLVDARLGWEFGTRSTVQTGSSRSRRFPWRPTLAAAAALTLVSGSTLLWQSIRKTNSAKIVENTADHSISQPVRSIARIGLADGARWQSTGKIESLPVGTWLSPGMINLREGSATLIFDAGARLTMTAPCRIELVDPARARLLEGAVSADVPSPAIGFTIDTPEGSITDLSTRFGVSVAKNKNEVQVFKGEVIVRYGKDLSSNKLIREKSGVALRPDGGGSRIFPAAYQPDLFPSEPPNTHPPGKPHWAVGHLHWSFDSFTANQTFPSSGTLPDASDFAAVLSGNPSPQVNPQVSGPFGKALHLNGDGTFLKTSFPGVAGAGPRTIAFWVRIPPAALPTHAYSIIGWGHPGFGVDSQKWEIGWNTGEFPKLETGRQGAVRTDFGLGHTIGTTDLRDGRWHHVASVFTGGPNPDASTHIRHYVDGRLEGYSAFRQQPINTSTEPGHAIPAVIGRYLAGENPKFGTFHGSIDEIYVFSAALTPDQILRLFNSNEPPSDMDLLPGF